jgi:hypothetical protein
MTIARARACVLPKLGRSILAWALHAGGAWLASMCFGALSMPASVLAHAGPQVRDIRPEGRGHRQLLVSNRGLIVRGSSSANWQLMCNEALGVSTVEIPDLAELSDGRLLAGTVRGLKISADLGCSWQAVEPYAELTVPSLAQHPTQLDRVYITTYGPGESGLRSSDDGGAHWRALLEVEDSDYLRYIRIAPSQPQHIYVRSLHFGSGSAFSYDVLHSSDAGQSWQRHALDLIDTETDLILLGVSPIDENLVVAKAEAGNPAVAERLLVSHDAGKSFSDPLKTHVITAVAWSADGNTLWVAADEGLWRSSDGAQSFQRVGPAEYVSCVLERDGQLLACGFYRGVSAGYPGIGVSSNGGETFERWMGLTDVVQPLLCGADSATATACAALWTDWQREILGSVDAAPDAGTPDAAMALDARAPTDAAGETDASSNHRDADVDADGGRERGPLSTHAGADCGCRGVAANTVAAREGASWLLAGLLLGGLWQRGRQRRIELDRKAASRLSRQDTRRS